MFNVISFLVVVLMARASLGQLDCFGEGIIPRRPNIPAVTKGADNFAIKAFSSIATTYPSHSIVLSPYSIWSVLNLAYYGSNGETESQLRNALGVPSKNDAFFGSSALEMRLKLNEGTVFNKADLAYFDYGLTLRECASNKIVALRQIDFSNSTAASMIINKAVSSATGGKINNFLNSEILKNAEFVLLNAVYFKGIWKYKFKERETILKPFYDESRLKKLSDIKMMTVQAKFNYAQPAGLGASVLDLPYKDSNISMVVILPDVNNSITRVLEELSSDRLDQIVQNDLKMRDVFVNLPRFKMTTRIEKEVKQVLLSLGISDIFNPKADLTKFVQENLFVDKVLHHSTIEVTEEGTVATAVTGLIGTRSGAANLVAFVADRPFIYMIRDNSQGLTLFTGVLRHPSHVDDV